MQVLFDVSCLDHERISGVGTYARHLLQALAQDRELGVMGVWKLSRHNRLRFIRANWQGPLLPFVPLITPLFAGARVYHGPDYRLPITKNTATVVTIHDLAFYLPGNTGKTFSQQRQEIVEFTLKKRRPQAVIAVSEFTRQEIIERFPEYKDRVHTVWHGADHLLVPANRSARVIKQPYFLFVGNLELRKNIIGLLKAFDILKQDPNYRDTLLVLVGKPGFGFEEIMEVAKNLKSREHIVLPGFIANMDLINYYQWAEAFVYPSLYEGFGFPILEAMRLGTPVITGNVSAMPEVAGGAALLVDPLLPEAIAEAMKKISVDQDLRKQLLQSGLVRGSQFTWKDCANKTKNVYQVAAAAL